jgi:hypothetical protein
LGSSLGDFVRAGMPGAFCMSVKSICTREHANTAVWGVRGTMHGMEVRLLAQPTAATYVAGTLIEGRQLRGAGLGGGGGLHEPTVTS